MRPYAAMILQRRREPFDDRRWPYEVKLNGQPALRGRRNERSVDRAS